MHISMNEIKSNIVHSYNVVANQVGQLANRTVQVIHGSVETLRVNPYVRNATFVAAVVALAKLSESISQHVMTKLSENDMYSVKTQNNIATLVRATLPTIAMVAGNALFNTSIAYAVNPSGYLLNTAITAFAVTSAVHLVKALQSNVVVPA